MDKTFRKKWIELYNLDALRHCKYEDDPTYAGRNNGHYSITNRLRIKLFVSLAEGKVLDVGCADGHFVIECMKRGLFAIGCDCSIIMLEQAKDLARKEGVQPTFIQSFAEELPFKDGTFTTVFLGEILEHVINPYLVFKEAVRVLKVRGKIIASVPNPLYKVTYNEGGNRLHINKLTFEDLASMYAKHNFAYSFLPLEERTPGYDPRRTAYFKGADNSDPYRGDFAIIKGILLRK